MPSIVVEIIVFQVERVVAIWDPEIIGHYSSTEEARFWDLYR